MNTPEVIHTQIWEETPEPDNPFAAATCYCHGYDVYGDLLGKASWIEYLYLLFKGERPTPAQGRLLEGLAIASANLGPQDYSVQAAMVGGAGASTSARLSDGRVGGQQWHVSRGARNFYRRELLAGMW